jgi:DNA-binding GntR family transcriptional regulator
MAKQNSLFKHAYNRSLQRFGTLEVLPSEPEISEQLGVSRTTVRAILNKMHEDGLIEWNKRSKAVLRPPAPTDFFPLEETQSTRDAVERGFMKRLQEGHYDVGSQINELVLARDLGVSTSSVREFLIRFSRFGLIEKRPQSHWVLKGFTLSFALELADIREMFELRSALMFATLPKSHGIWRDLNRIELEHLAMRDNIDVAYKDFSELDERFHRLIHGATDNRFIIEFYDIISMVFHYHFQWNKRDEKLRNKTAIEEHLNYIAALKSGDVIETELTCRRHLRSARETLIKSTGVE